MPTVEIDETELTRYRQLAGFVQTALSNPKTRRKILEADKTLNPDKAIPELDAADPLHDELKALREEMQKDRDERKTAEETRKTDADKAAWDRKWDQGREWLRQQRLPDERIKEVEDLMAARSIPDHEAGLRLFESLHPAPPPVMTGSSRFGWFDGETKDQPDVKLLLDQQYDDFLGQAIDKARADFRATGQ